MSRDPRNNPQRGDVLEKGNPDKDGERRTVLERGIAKSVRFMRRRGGRQMQGSKSITCWWRWAKNATVVKVAEA